MSHKIFVEGIDDKIFIKAVIEELKIKDFDSEKNIQHLRGWNLDKENIKQIKRFKTKNEKGKVLVIIDADSNDRKHKKGGFQKRKEYIEKINKKEDLNFELFIIPNNKGDGSLETLLEKMIKPEHGDILECFEEYKTCLGGKNEKYYPPDDKAKMYAYVDALVEGKLDKNWLFETKDYWNLDAECLEPLKKCLIEFLK